MPDQLRDALLAAIATHPDDDTPRLVYADWLEQQGDLARAMLFRVQCERARAPHWDRRWLEASWEEDALLAEHGETWRAELPVLDGVTWTDYTRGLPSAVSVTDVATLHRHAAAIASVGSIACLGLQKLDEEATPLPPEGLPWLHTLRLEYSDEHRAHPRHSVLSAAKVIEISAVEEMDADLSWLARRADVPLAELRITGRHTVGLPFLDALIAQPWLKSLEHLEIGTAFVDWDSGYYGDATLRGDGAVRLAAAKLDRVVALDVSRQRLGTDGLAAVIASMPNLHELVACGCEATALDVLATDGTPIRRLDLGENPIGDTGARLVAGAPRFAALESLALETCEISGAGLTALAHAPFWSTLQTLNLARNPLGLDGVLALIGANPPPRVHTLRLDDIDLTAEAANLLADARWWRELLCIDLSANETSDRLLAAVAAGGARDIRIAKANLMNLAPLAPAWERAVALDLADNPFGDAGLDRLVTDKASTLQRLDLRNCKLTAAAIDILVDRARCPRLRTLILRDNAIGAAGLARLVGSEFVQTLAELDLTNCGMSDDMVPVLVAAPPLSRLRTLRLIDNKVGHASVFAIAEVASLRATPRITLSGDPWSIGDDDDTDEGEAKADAQRAALLARFGPAWWYEDKVETEIPEYYQRAREANP